MTESVNCKGLTRVLKTTVGWESVLNCGPSGPTHCKRVNGQRKETSGTHTTGQLCYTFDLIPRTFTLYAASEHCRPAIILWSTSLWWVVWLRAPFAYTSSRPTLTIDFNYTRRWLTVVYYSFVGRPNSFCSATRTVLSWYRPYTTAKDKLRRV